MRVGRYAVLAVAGDHLTRQRDELDRGNRWIERRSATVVETDVRLSTDAGSQAMDEQPARGSRFCR